MVAVMVEAMEVADIEVDMGAVMVVAMEVADIEVVMEAVMVVAMGVDITKGKTTEVEAEADGRMD